MAGFITDNPVLGGMMGGNFLGSMIGAEMRDMLNPDQQPNNNVDFGDGQFGGAGAGGSWGDDNTTTVSPDVPNSTVVSDNFS